MDRKNNIQPDNHAPFQDGENASVFFSGAQRRKLLDEIKKSIAEGVAVITLTGEEGTGKTMICRKMEKELPAETLSVYLPDTLGSFDDVVRAVALKVGTPNADKPLSTNILVDEIVEALQENTGRLVLVFDQAERMFLATIERIRKLLDRMNGDSILLQIIFVGRRSLLENLRQLEICNFREVEEKHFSLNPLGLSETYAYLNHCARERSPGRGKNLFTPEAAKKIFSMAQGNLRMTSMLAAKSLDAADSETSFMVLLDNISTREEVTDSRKKILAKVRLPKRQLTLGGAGLLFLLVLVFLFRGEDREPEISSVDSGKRSERAAIAGADVKEAVKTADAAAESESVSSTSGKKNSRPSQISPAGMEKTLQITPAAVTDGKPASAKEAHPPVEQEREGSGRTEDAHLAAARDSQTGTEKPEAEKVMEKEMESAAISPAPAAPPEMEEHTTGTGERTKTAEAKTAEAEMAKAEMAEVETAEVEMAEAETAEVEMAEAEMAEAEAAEDTRKITVQSLAVEEKPDETTGPEDKEAPAAVHHRESLVLVDDPDKDAPAAAEHTGGEPAPGRTALPIPEAGLGAATDETAEEGMDEPAEEYAGSVDSVDSVELEPVVFADMKKKRPRPQAGEVVAKRIVKIAPARIKIPVGAVSLKNVGAVPDIQVSAAGLFDKRASAGGEWLSGGAGGSHTLQLMALSAEHARDSLTERFEKEEFREIADRLYIVSGSSSTVHVYYGEYPDLDSARQARNDLPVFLRELDPYAVTVEGAIAKGRSAQ